MKKMKSSTIILIVLLLAILTLTAAIVLPSFVKSRNNYLHQQEKIDSYYNH